MANFNMVTVKLPLTKELQDDVFVAVNRHKYQIRRGVAVQVPDFVAEVLRMSEESDQHAIMERRRLQSRALR